MRMFKKLKVFQRREGKTKTLSPRRRQRRNVKNKKAVDTGLVTPISSLSSSNVNTSSSSDTGNTSGLSDNSQNTPIDTHTTGKGTAKQKGSGNLAASTISNGDKGDSSGSVSNQDKGDTTKVVIDTNGDLETLLSTLTIQKEKEEQEDDVIVEEGEEDGESSASDESSSSSSEEEEEEYEENYYEEKNGISQALYDIMECNHEQFRHVVAMIDDTSTIGSVITETNNQIGEGHENDHNDGLNLKSMVETLRKSEQKQTKKVFSALNYLDTLCAPSPAI